MLMNARLGTNNPRHSRGRNEVSSNAKLKRLLECFPRLKPVEVVPRQSAKRFVEETRVERVAANRAAAEIKGRFGSRAELVEYLGVELSAGAASHDEIAAKAGIRLPTLKYLIAKGAV